MEVKKQVMMDRKQLPVLAESDILVVGGGFGGVAAALAAAEAGHRVVLVEPRTNLGREVTACLRPFLAIPAGNDWPSLFQSCVQAAGVVVPEQGLIVLRMADLKTHLEDRLLAAGVELLYASLPMSLVTESDRITGIVIGNKSGRQVIRARAVVDATETALLYRLAQNAATAEPAGAPPENEKDALFFRTLAFDHVDRADVGRMAVPQVCQMAGNEVRLVPGAHGEGHWLVELAMLLPAHANNPFDLTAREIAARERSIALAAHLRKNVPGFERAYLAGASQLLTGPIAPGLLRISTTVTAMHADVLHMGYGLASRPLAEFTGPVPGLFGLPQTLDAPGGHRDGMVFTASATGEALGAWLAKQALANFPAGPAGGLMVHASGEHSLAVEGPLAVETSNLQVKEPESPQRGRRYPLQPVPPSAVPVVREVDVLVIGGGTSGATAAYAAAMRGAKTLLVEAAPGLGGTGTFGGVHSYWFGRRVGFSAQIIHAVDAMHAALGLEPPEGGLLKWNIEAKMHALLRRALDAGVEVLWGAVATGALVDGQQVRGVVVATALGPLALCARVVIDATGDGDVPYFAGAQVVYGAERDHVTMWYSIAQFYRPGVTRNNFTSMVDVGNVKDYTRAILAGRRRVTGTDQGTYVAPRESRHVLADVVLSLNDQLLKRCWPDTVSIAFSNHDIKGHSSSDWLRIGLIPPNLEVEIPYRALLPKGLEGILIAGKAFSATHDALPAVRMQPDLENLGGVAGAAAAMAVRAGCAPRQIDVRALQAEMAALGVLPETILQRTLEPVLHTSETLADLAGQMAAAKPIHLYQDMDLDVVFEERIPFVDLCCAGPAAVPVLRKALDQFQGPARVLIAKALAMVESNAGVPELIAALHAETPDEGLQYRTTHVRHVQLPPDQGAMPEAANLLYALGMAHDERALPIWDHFSALIAETSEDAIRDRNLGLFYYIDALCFGAERLGDPRAVPFLKRIHAHPSFRGRSVSQGFEPDFFFERQAYLELVIARALARCGERVGYEVLIGYLEDARALLAEHAHSELCAITAQDFGKDIQRWLAWLSTTDTWRAPHPVETPNDAVQAWKEQILLPAKRFG